MKERFINLSKMVESFNSGKSKKDKTSLKNSTNDSDQSKNTINLEENIFDS